jgi:hypothetical protein
VSRITIASIAEKPLFFNRYTPWVATAKFATKSGQGPKEGEKAMRMIIGIAALVFVCVFSVSGDLQALSLEDMATVVQINSCQDCEGVEQQNLAFIFQDISANNVFMYIPNLITSKEAFMKNIVNIASVIQGNICIDCARVNQQNIVTIFQEIDIDNFLVNHNIYEEYLSISQTEISNITDISQINECVVCQNVDQINSVFILQNIGSEDLFTSTSGSIAHDPLFSDLVNIARVIYSRTSESDVQDGEGTYRKFKRYFVPVRPGVHSPKQLTGTR